MQKKNRLSENDAVKEKVEADHVNLTPMTKCESCHDNTEKVHATPVAKGCCRDCDQKICNICHDAHKKIKITRNHMIFPYG